MCTQETTCKYSFSRPKSLALTTDDDLYLGTVLVLYDSELCDEQQEKDEYKVGKWLVMISVPKAVGRQFIPWSD